jgi:hypothetical protein
VPRFDSSQAWFKSQARLSRLLVAGAACIILSPTLSAANDLLFSPLEYLPFFALGGVLGVTLTDPDVLSLLGDRVLGWRAWVTDAVAGVTAGLALVDTRRLTAPGWVDDLLALVRGWRGGGSGATLMVLAWPRADCGSLSVGS